MRTRFIIILCGVLATLIFISVCTSLRTREPQYQGKALSVWIEELSKATNADGWAREEILTNVVQAVGTNGIPYYLGLMTNSNDDLRRYWGSQAIVILGTNAVSAIPTLAGLIDKGHGGNGAQRGLVAIGPAAIPAVIGVVETSTNLTRATAIEILGEYGPPAKSAVPILTQIIQSDSPLAWPATEALVEIETNQAVILPLLALHISDTNTDDGNSAIGAAYALGRLGNAGVPMLLMMLTNETRIARASALGALDPAFQKYSKDKSVTNAPGFQRLQFELNMGTTRAGIRAYGRGDFVSAAETAAQFTNSPDATIRETANNMLAVLRPLAATNVPQSQLDRETTLPHIPPPPTNDTDQNP